MTAFFSICFGLNAQNANYLLLYSGENVLCSISTSHEIRLSVLDSELFISQDEQIISFELNELTKYVFSSNSEVKDISADECAYFIEDNKLSLNNLSDKIIISIFSINGNLLFNSKAASVENSTIDLKSFNTNFLIINIGESTFKVVLK